MQKVHAGVLLLMLSGCGTVLFNKPRSEQADQWSYTLLEVRDGPNGWSNGGTLSFKPGDGERFVSATITFRNNATSKREFTYEACDIDAGDRALLPVIIDRDMGVNSMADGVESYAPNEERTRKLIFSYPEDAMPTRVHCGLAEIALK